MRQKTTTVDRQMQGFQMEKEPACEVQIKQELMDVIGNL